ncbi:MULTISPECIES: aminotransferase class I/II-fold pyridoxal phosphate-dependent enzyme [Mesoflavibacter]|jgi:glycine C-acetyltransferase|uniref:8-amino-7-oxononanoate synthase n=1 Tax=Mesoflavibacter zeaxanthinifaciens subsp. sabulilitoris TaxID=1520893 RepID=A0A2T1NGS1_9FLAO|nr:MULTISPECIES: aminotransferase class I/II-fold pyridoxal phosphate-dependent enzyme [Mesoflavibacter]MBB3122857.1 glycine C-acetyltransferase [Mesoflavibacter zeaxanthinifaciens subsp. sabulilitoris]PSG92063.1 8-amino-7-oxononanoate synthase [Mesoflavibacter zeaxanthinifaciens subsp. sabulilitoris]UAB75244.1 aminotransferase class I/II-fold pyridoxal phosphate-dependent enzyme [Mesoflavibacter sp. SCSIO 43206]
MKDLFEKIYKDKGPLGKWASQAEGYFVFPKLEGQISNRMKFQGKEVITWSINDYLGLANHPEVRKVDAEAAAKYGSAYPMGARMMSGHTDLHEKLQNELAEFVNKEAAYLLNFGYQGMVSTVDALVSKDDIIVYDVDAHACIIDGVRLHHGKRFTYKHNDIESLEKNLERATKMAEQTGGGILVISEGVFGMRGEQGRLKEIVALKEKFNFRLFVDDAHGFGTLGATGAGAGEEQGVQDDIDVYFATFAKSMASTGAFIAADQEIIDYLKYNLRSQMFAKSLQMQLVEGALKRLDMLRTMPELKQNLWKIVDALQSGLKERGFDIGTTQSCVTPVYLNGSIPEAMALVKDLRENYGIFCSIVVYPVIPKGLILLRMIPTATHTLEDVNETLDAFDAIRERLVNGTYKRMSAALIKAMGE